MLKQGHPARGLRSCVDLAALASCAGLEVANKDYPCPHTTLYVSGGQKLVPGDTQQPGREQRASPGHVSGLSSLGCPRPSNQGPEPTY